MKLSGKVLLTYFITNLTSCQEIKRSQIVPVCEAVTQNVELENLLKVELFNE